MVLSNVKLESRSIRAEGFAETDVSVDATKRSSLILELFRFTEEIWLIDLKPVLSLDRLKDCFVSLVLCY